LGSPNETDYIVLRDTKLRVRETLLEWVFESLGEQPTPPVSPLSTTVDE
jgi:hypothetical protein